MSASLCYMDTLGCVATLVRLENLCDWNPTGMSLRLLIMFSGKIRGLLLEVQVCSIRGSASALRKTKFR